MRGPSYLAKAPEEVQGASCSEREGGRSVTRSPQGVCRGAVRLRRMPGVSGCLRITGKLRFGPCHPSYGGALLGRHRVFRGVVMNHVHVRHNSTASLDSRFRENDKRGCEGLVPAGGLGMFAHHGQASLRPCHPSYGGAGGDLLPRVWGCPPVPFFPSPKSGGQGVETRLFGQLLTRQLCC
jgi:hypothetical protein